MFEQGDKLLTTVKECDRMNEETKNAKQNSYIQVSRLCAVCTIFQPQNAIFMNVNSTRIDNKMQRNINTFERNVSGRTKTTTRKKMVQDPRNKRLPNTIQGMMLSPLFYFLQT